MKKMIISTICIFGFLMTNVASAAVPQSLMYSGFLTDGGVPADTSAAVIFELYSTEEGGSAVWSEAHTNVAVEDGMFSVDLGSMNGLSSVLDGNVYYLQVTVDGDTMMPRTPFNSVPYAMKAGDADTVGGQTVSQIQSGVTVSGADAVPYDNSTSGLAAGNMQGVIDELLARIEALESQNTAQQTAIETNTTAVASNAAAIEDAVWDIDANAADIATNGTTISANALDVDALESITQDMSRDGDDLYFSGVNVHVVDGTGNTWGASGLGNLIVGYDEARTTDSVKSGTHNLVIGSYHNYSSYGCLVAGESNAVLGTYATVSGGSNNVASGPGSVVTGGYENLAEGSYAAVSGGQTNQATNGYASVSGGQGNIASGAHCSISGGYENAASGTHAAVSGGYQNFAGGSETSVSGGYQNSAIDGYSSILGGNGNELTFDSIDNYRTIPAI